MFLHIDVLYVLYIMSLWGPFSYNNDILSHINITQKQCNKQKNVQIAGRSHYPHLI